MDVIRITGDDDSTISDLTDVVSLDPALTGRLLRLVNSSLFGVTREIASLERATVMLGFKTVALITLGFSLADDLEGGNGFPLEDYWRRSLTAAVGGRMLAKKVTGVDPDEAFLGGLLSFVGRLTISRCLPGEYQPILDSANGWPPLGVEARQLGFDSAQVGAGLMERWELPSRIVHVVALAQPGSSIPETIEVVSPDLVDVVRGAVELAGVLAGGADDEGHLLDSMQHRLRHLGVSETELLGFMDHVLNDVEETSRAFDLSIGTGLQAEAMLSQAKEQFELLRS